MKFIIHFTVLDAYGEPHDDSVVVEGPTVEDIQEQATSQISVRNGIDPWSEEVADETS